MIDIGQCSDVRLGETHYLTDRPQICHDVTVHADDA